MQLILILYLLMQQIATQKNLLNLMSECLQQLKQIPMIIQSLHKSNSQNNILQIIKYSNKYIELANMLQEMPQKQKQSMLLHRFCYRIREIIRNCLNYYSHTHMQGASHLLVKELFVQVNQYICQRLQHKNYKDHKQNLQGEIIRNLFIPIFQGICAILRSFGNKIIKIEKLDKNKQFIKQLNQIKVEFHKKQQIKIVRIDKTEQIIKKKQKQQKIKKNNEQKIAKQLMKTQASLASIRSISKQGLQTLKDLDIPYFENIQKCTDAQQVFRQSLTRNRFIHNIIHQYQQKHKLYINKPQHRKNRQHPEYNPTNLTIPIKKNTSRKYHFRLQTQISKQQKSKSKMKVQINKTRCQQNDQFILQRSITAADNVKQQLLEQINECRKKYSFHMSKVMIGETADLMNSLNQTIHNANQQGVKKFINFNNKPKSQRFTKLNQNTKNIRMKTLSSRMNITGPISMLIS